jgi:hypothetical protein
MIHPSTSRRVLASLVFMALAVLALRAYMHIRDGRAAETYENAYGFHIMWAQAATILASITLLLLIAYALRWWQAYNRARQEGVSMATILKELKPKD